MAERDAKGHFIKKVKEPIAEVDTVIVEEPVAERHATPTLPILTAVDALIGRIRENHPDLPPVTVVVGAQGANGRRMVHGHFYPESWQGGEAKHEIMLSGESLARGAVATLGTILHESAHAIAHARGIKDTSNNNRYHNKRFKAIAEDELGLELENVATLGWSITTVPENTQEDYADEIEALAAVLTTYRAPRHKVVEKKKRKTTKFSVDCGCGKPVTVSKQWFEDAQSRLVCNDCLEAFEPVEADEDEDEN